MKFSVSSYAISNQNGQLAMTVVVFLAGITLVVVYAFSVIVLKQEKIVRAEISAKQSYFTAEAGQEDVLYRLISGRTVDNQETISLGANTASTTITPGPDWDTVTTRAASGPHTRSVTSLVTPSDRVSFNFGVQAGEGGIILENNSSVAGNAFSNGPVIGSGNIIRGDVVSAGPFGIIHDVHATNTARAHTIEDSYIEGDAYYQSITGSTVLGTEYPGSPDQPTSTLPISDELVEEWKTAAEDGGTISSPCPYVVDEDASLGPVKISCDLEIKMSPTVTLGGMVWVEGDVIISNSPTIRVASGLGNKSAAIIADNPADRITSSKVDSNNTATFEGSGAGNSYVLLLSQNESAEQGGGEVAILVANKSTGDLLIYAGHGEVLLRNNIELREVTAYRLRLQNFSEVIYETGLSSLLFGAGPSGGLEVLDWREVE